MSLVGELPKKGDTTHVSKYNHIGMSSGVVCADFWLNTGFPLLIERFKVLNTYDSL